MTKIALAIYFLAFTVFAVSDLERRSNFAKLVWIITFLLCLVSSAVSAHDWYPRECCAAQLDCAPVPCNALSSRPQGAVEYTPAQKFFESSKVRPSQDSQCHVCLHGSEKSPICVFIQQGA